MDLILEEFEDIEAPMSDFEVFAWAAAAAGAGVSAGFVAAIVIT